MCSDARYLFALPVPKRLERNAQHRHTELSSSSRLRSPLDFLIPEIAKVVHKVQIVRSRVEVRTTLVLSQHLQPCQVCTAGKRSGRIGTKPVDGLYRA